ncbi:ABC transporter permease [Demequina sp. SYSU T00039]|uniref:Transport permease protein n=1 Tax=Demequina lignilytica TaxID=3051663 RepID=A0AAW7M3Q3_9MICO|nr:MULTISPECIES: ABC transporter permease [unclassified Demequina]MDN4477886.1 ABC transporter permease [Demequina sp. SYSU T00039-1]MDN4487795.1 ABC transporter permease [Demequina sp. SYSU T00039]MDN4490822.1 ABC transporter permease [Demequina sp. SYSU T00068]
MADIDYRAVAIEAGLPRVGARPSLWRYLVDLWHRRRFATTLARYRLEATLSEQRLGIAWVVISPLLQAAVYGTVFGIIMTSDSRPDNFVPFLVTGFFLFTFFSQSFSQGAKALTGNVSLVRSLHFPRMLLPVSAVLKELYTLAPMLVVLVAILIGFGELPTLNWLLMVPILALMTMFNLGVALIAARLTVHLRDIGQLIPIITRILFYASGIFYSIDLVLAPPAHPAWMLQVAQFNPVHAFIELGRGALQTTQELEPLLWVVASGSALVTLVFGVVFFWRAEERYGRA